MTKNRRKSHQCIFHGEIFTKPDRVTLQCSHNVVHSATCSKGDKQTSLTWHNESGATIPKMYWKSMVTMLIDNVTV